MEEAIYEAEQRAYEEGYAEGEYYALGELERFKSEYGDTAYEAGYEHGYEIGYDDGYYDCLEEHGLIPKTKETGPRPRIEKDR